MHASTFIYDRPGDIENDGGRFVMGGGAGRFVIEEGGERFDMGEGGE